MRFARSRISSAAMAGLPFSSLMCSVTGRAGSASKRTGRSLRNPTSWSPAPASN